MDKHSEEAKYHIVSLRVSTQERDSLRRLCGATNKCISDVMREALHKLAVFDGRSYPALARQHSSRRRIRRNSGF